MIRERRDVDVKYIVYDVLLNIKELLSGRYQTTAIKTYYSGVSGRGVGHIFRMSKSNVYNWIKKLNNDVENLPNLFELDELY